MFSNIEISWTLGIELKTTAAVPMLKKLPLQTYYSFSRKISFPLTQDVQLVAVTEQVAQNEVESQIEQLNPLAKVPLGQAEWQTLL